jgi:hypothetical protein
MFQASHIHPALLLTLLSLAAALSGCARENPAQTAYQNVPQIASSTPSAAIAPATTSSVMNEARGPVNDTVQARPAVVESPVQEAPKSLPTQVPAVADSRREPALGMTAEEVKVSSWGEPIDDVGEEVVEGIVHTWNYDRNRSVKFSPAGVVTEISR